MGFLGKLFGKEEEKKAAATPKARVKTAVAEKSIPKEKVGLDGKFDESGLAKRVAREFDEAGLPDDVGLWVAQTGSTVVLKYNPDAESVLSRAQEIARKVDGCDEVVAEPNR